jgi:hypothetical protein
MTPRLDGLLRQPNTDGSRNKKISRDRRGRNVQQLDLLVIPDRTTEIGRFSANLEGSGQGHEWFIGETTCYICMLNLTALVSRHELILEKSNDSDEGHDRGASNLGDQGSSITSRRASDSRSRLSSRDGSVGAGQSAHGSRTSNDRRHSGQVVGGADESLRKGIVGSHEDGGRPSLHSEIRNVREGGRAGSCLDGNGRAGRVGSSDGRAAILSSAVGDGRVTAVWRSVRDSSDGVDTARRLGGCRTDGIGALSADSGGKLPVNEAGGLIRVDVKVIEMLLPNEDVSIKHL